MIRADRISPQEAARLIREAVRAPFVCELPRPPSINSLWRAPTKTDGKRLGRIKTKTYDTWQHKAGWALRAARAPRLFGRYALVIEIGRRKGADLDNFAKAINDLLVSMNVVRDDSDCERLTLTWADDLPANRCRIELRDLG